MTSEQKAFLEGFHFAMRLVDEIGVKNWTYEQYTQALQRLSLLDKRSDGEYAREFLEDAGETPVRVDDLL
jgi:hypothetical protein